MAYLLIGGFVAPLIQLILYSHGNRLGSNPGKNRDPGKGVSCVAGVPGRRPVLMVGKNRIAQLSWYWDNDFFPNSSKLKTQPKNPQKTFVEVAATDIGPSFKAIRPAEDSHICNSDGFPAHSKPNLEEII